MADIPLVAVRRRLEDACASRPPSYTRIWQAVAGGYLPGATNIHGRWLVDETCIPAIAAYFGMTPKAKPAKRAKVAA